MLFISSKFGICTVVGHFNVRILVSTYVPYRPTRDAHAKFSTN
jgi:hypothetical protein